MRIASVQISERTERRWRPDGDGEAAGRSDRRITRRHRRPKLRLHYFHRPGRRLSTANCDCGIVLELDRACPQNRLGTLLADPRIRSDVSDVPEGGGIGPVADDALSP